MMSFNSASSGNSSVSTESTASCEDRSHQYKLGKPIGSGAFGTVFSAETPSGAKCAVKVTSNSADNRNEGAFLQRLQDCDAVLGFQDSFVAENGQLWTVLELVPGENLAWTLGGRPVSAKHAAYVAHCLARAVRATHKRNVLHLDIKSDNILVNKVTGAVLLADYGRAVDARNPPECRGEVMCWSAPEVVRCESYSSAADIWSLGAVVYEVATGAPPFFGLSPEEMARQICEEAPPRLSRDEFPALLCDFVERCLQRDPAQRASASELLQHPFLLAACSPEEFASLASGADALKKDLKYKEQELVDFHASRADLVCKATQSGVRGLVARFELVQLDGSGMIEGLTRNWLEARAKVRGC